MKKISLVVFAFIIVAIPFSSCSTHHEVVSGNFIKKRKYRKGYHVQLPTMFKDVSGSAA